MRRVACLAHPSASLARLLADETLHLSGVHGMAAAGATTARLERWPAVGHVADSHRRSRWAPRVVSVNGLHVTNTASRRFIKRNEWPTHLLMITTGVRPLALLLPLVACSGADCVALPCPQPLAISLTISSAVPGGGVPVANVDVSGPMQSSFSCSGTCPIFGSAGTYHITVSAPGFARVEQSVQVRGANPPCGCATTAPEKVTITLGEPTASKLARDRTLASNRVPASGSRFLGIGSTQGAAASTPAE